MLIRKPPRIQFDHASLDDPKAVGRTINRIQDAIINTIDQLVQQANAANTPAGQLAPAGSVVAFAGATAPTGYLMCNGSAVSRATYAALFAAIGVAYGPGDGGTTFNLPDLRSRVPVGAGQGAGLTNRPLAGVGGEESHIITAGELAAHNHAVTDPGHTHLGFGAGITGTALGAQYATNLIAIGNQPVQATQSATTGVTTQNAGSGAAHNNMQPFLAMNFIIKT